MFRIRLIVRTTGTATSIRPDGARESIIAIPVRVTDVFRSSVPLCIHSTLDGCAWHAVSGEPFSRSREMVLSMPSSRLSTVRTIQYLLAVLVILVGIITVTDVPQPYPSWPTLGPIPVDPELVLPVLLGLAVLVGTSMEERSVTSVGLGSLGALTLWIASRSLYELAVGGTGGVFWGGFFTLILAFPLASAILVRGVLREDVSRYDPRHLCTKFGE